MHNCLLSYVFHPQSYFMSPTVNDHGLYFTSLAPDQVAFFYLSRRSLGGSFEFVQRHCLELLPALYELNGGRLVSTRQVQNLLGGLGRHDVARGHVKNGQDRHVHNFELLGQLVLELRCACRHCEEAELLENILEFEKCPISTNIDNFNVFVLAGELVKINQLLVNGFALLAPRSPEVETNQALSLGGRIDGNLLHLHILQQM